MSEKSFKEILDELDPALFEPSEMDNYDAPSRENKNSEFLYQEDIAPGLAKRLLGPGDAFDPTCTYQLITQVDSITVVKIDPSYPADKEPVYDDKGFIVKGHIVEYPLSVNEEVEDYATLLHNATDGVSRKPSDLNYYRDIYETKKSKLVPITIGVFGLLIIISAVLTIFVYQFR